MLQQAVMQGSVRAGGRQAPGFWKTHFPQGPLPGETSGYQRRGRHSGMAWLDSALFAHGL